MEKADNNAKGEDFVVSKMKTAKRKFEDVNEIFQSCNKQRKVSHLNSVEEICHKTTVHVHESESSFGFEKPTVMSAEVDIRTIAKCTEEILRTVDSVILPEKDSSTFVKVVQKDLKYALRKVNKHFDIIPFGSFMNELVCHGSDLDFFFKTRAVVKTSKEIRSLIHRSYSELLKSEVFCGICKIMGARIPIIKFVHKQTQINCDLSFTNEVGVRNTLLVKFYLGLNPHIKTVVLFLKYLLTQYDLHGVQRITTYMLFWLVVYYMQQLDILPPVQIVRNLVTEEYVIDGWDCRVPQVFNTPVPNSFSLFSHLTKFLKFYSEFPFLEYVISPYLGCPLPLNDFDRLQIPEDRFGVYLQKVRDGTDTTFNFNVMNVQDPTEININITRQVTLHALNKFRSFCYHLYNFFTIDLNTKFNSNRPLKEALPKTIPENVKVPRNCVQSTCRSIRVNNLANDHPLRLKFAEDGVKYFAKLLETFLKTRFECDVKMVISEETLRINRPCGSHSDGLRRKLLPAAYFKCSRIRNNVKDADSENTSLYELFIFVDTTFGGEEVRIRFESQVGLLRSMEHNKSIVDLLTKIPEIAKMDKI